MPKITTRRELALRQAIAQGADALRVGLVLTVAPDPVVDRVERIRAWSIDLLVDPDPVHRAFVAAASHELVGLLLHCPMTSPARRLAARAIRLADLMRSAA